MKIHLSDVKLEIPRVEVPASQAKRTRRRYEKNGWQQQGGIALQHGKAQMTFCRRSAGTVEVQP